MTSDVNEKDELGAGSGENKVWGLKIGLFLCESNGKRMRKYCRLDAQVLPLGIGSSCELDRK